MEQWFAEKELWHKYDFLTQEMLKFLKKDDTETFLELLQQRNFLESGIFKSGERTFIRSEEGRTLLKRVIAQTQQLIALDQQWINRAKLQRQVGSAYENSGFANATLGWDKKF